jgi:hypothetical protein
LFERSPGSAKPMLVIVPVVFGETEVLLMVKVNWLPLRE